MKEQLIAFETAKLAKEKGFDYCISTWYKESGNLQDENSELHVNVMRDDGGIPYFRNSDFKSNECSAPAQSILQKWLREVHNLDVLITKPEVEHWDVYVWGETKELFFPNECAKFYEEALEKGLKEALKLIKL